MTQSKTASFVSSRDDGQTITLLGLSNLGSNDVCPPCRITNPEDSQEQVFNDRLGLGILGIALYNLSPGYVHCEGFPESATLSQLLTAAKAPS